MPEIISQPGIINPTRIFLGYFDAKLVVELIASRKWVLVTTKSLFRSEAVNAIINKAKNPPTLIIDNISANPSKQNLELLINKLDNTDVEVILAIGGGSCIDSSKVLARLISKNNKWTLNEMIEKQAPNEKYSSVPVIAIPTTTGTGSEVTPFSTIWDFDEQMKFSITGLDLYPEWALMFPELSLTAPKKILTASILDAISHAFDLIWNINSTVHSDHHSIQALKYLKPVMTNLQFDKISINEITDLAAGSLNAGLAISATRTSLAHSISYPLTATFGLLHGLACSFTLPAIIEYSIKNDFSKITQILTSPDIDLLSSYKNFFIVFFERSGAKDEFKKKIPNPQQINDLIPKMFNRDRIGNFYNIISENDISDIINKSAEIIYN